MTEGDTKRINNIIHFCDDCGLKECIQCVLKECIQCEISYGDIQAIKHLYEENEFKNKVIDEICKTIEDYWLDDIFCNKQNCYADKYDENGHCQKCINCIKEQVKNKLKGE